MIVVLLDAVALILLLKIMDDADVSLFTAFFVALGASIGTMALAFGLGMLIGVAGIAVAAVIVVALLGVVISALFGIEIKRSFLIGGIFMFIHIGISIGLQLLFR
ncbi:hypothetical protein Pan241w_02250 [Gimesia alba]|uniref:Uncharacterized protein n=1 Tax=Gimesia alba TaxID=2527973 RepID=A0A517R8E3_9PLAN|nr:hypothetical protein [Gimesia alba]QDT40169.1 hypothetical protein Pan241w_02250 [Gimesia alba]